MQAIESGKYKWVYTNANHTEEQVLNYIRNKEIDLNDCWRIVEDQQFRKIRNGHFKERTPPAGRERQRKITN